MAQPTPAGGPTTAWVDAGAGVAGDMLLGALIDAGAALPRVHDAVEAVLPGAVRLRTSEVRRAGLRAARLEVTLAGESPQPRRWPTLRELLGTAALPEGVRQDALAVFTRLADAEAAVHGIPVQQVHYHEVGAWDSVADIVGCCAALADLGVGRGIGSAIGRALAADGHRVVLLDRDGDAAAGVAAAIEAEVGTPTAPVVADLADPGSIVTAVEDVVAAYGRLDVVVNNAGIEVGAHLAETSVDGWDTTLDVNLRAAMLICRAALPTWRASGCGAVVNVASRSARGGAKNPA